MNSFALKSFHINQVSKFQTYVEVGYVLSS